MLRAFIVKKTSSGLLRVLDLEPNFSSHTAEISERCCLKDQRLDYSWATGYYLDKGSKIDLILGIFHLPG